jgi:hypothetical protein
MKQLMLTTVDNPFDPFTQFDEWFAFDESSGYHSSSHIALVVQTSEELSEKQQISAMNEAVEYIVKHNVTGMFRAVSKEVLID